MPRSISTAEIIIKICIVIFLALGISLQLVFKAGVIATAISPAMVLASGAVYLISDIMFAILRRKKKAKGI